MLRHAQIIWLWAALRHPGPRKDTAIKRPRREVSSARRNMVAMAFGQARNAFLSAVGPLCGAFGKTSLSADLAPRKASSSEPGNLVGRRQRLSVGQGACLSRGHAEDQPGHVHALARARIRPSLQSPETSGGQPGYSNPDCP